MSGQKEKLVGDYEYILSPHPLTKGGVFVERKKEKMSYLWGEHGSFY